MRSLRPGPISNLACALAVAIVGAVVVRPAPAVAQAASKPATAATKPAQTTPTPSKSVKPAAAAVDSLPILEAAVKRDSTNARNLYKLGLAYLDRDRPAEAARMFEKATKVKPDYLEAWVNLGAAEDANGHGYAARLNYEKALKIRPGDEIALCRLAASYYASGQRDSAMTILRQTIKQNERSHCSYFTMGVAFADAGMFREAIRVWEKVVEYAPGSPEAESARESIKLLKEYLGPQQDATAAAAAGKGGAAASAIPLGAGGPGEPIKGGEMKPASTPADGHGPGDGHDHGEATKGADGKKK
ncbi:MAG: tetratricopeptide repeat protein [Candidatus Eiseniibacteriota bacterium]